MEKALTLFELLKKKSSGVEGQGDAAERLNAIVKEAEEMKADTEDKLKKVEGTTKNVT